MAGRKNVNFVLQNFTFNVPATFKFAVRIYYVAEKARFELAKTLRPYTLSKRASSTT